ncbi:MAG: hypothetical protein IK093_18705 [Ruminiclostridium sp.]|nr:hypothetical protein [Ruminiclostridium sp.]
MGDVEYAKLIDKLSMKGVKDTTDQIDNSDELLADSLETLMKSIKMSQSEDDPTTMGAAMLSQLLNGTLDDFFGFIPDNTELTVRSNLNVKLGSVLASVNDEAVQGIIDSVNSTSFVSSVTHSETNSVKFGIVPKGDDAKSGYVQLYTKDGNVAVTFPGISDQLIYITKEDLNEAIPGMDEKKEIEVPEIDGKEARRICKEIANVYFDSFGAAEITYTDNTPFESKITCNAGDIITSVKGNDVKIHFTPDQVNDMVGKMGDVLKNDAYLSGYMTKLLEISDEEYKKLFDQPADSKPIDLDITVDHIVDLHNNILYSGYTFKTDEGKGTSHIDFVDNDNVQFLRVSIDTEGYGDATIDFGNKKISATDGFSAISAYNGDHEIKFECSYTDYAVKKFLGKDVVTGNFVITPTDAGKLVDEIKELATTTSSAISDFNSDGYDVTGDMMVSDDGSGSNGPDMDAIWDEIKKVALTMESSVEGDSKYTSTFTLSIGEIGSFGTTSIMEKADKTLSMPDTSNAITLKNGGEKIETLMNDAVNWLPGFAGALDGGDGLLSQIAKSIAEGGSLFPGNDPIIDNPIIDNPIIDNPVIDDDEASAAIRKHYQAYEKDTSEWAAEDAAFDIYLDFSEQVFDAFNDGKANRGIIKVYFKDGKMQVLDDGGISGLDYNSGELDGVYAEAFYDKSIDDYNVLGVTVVLTDDPSDIPDDLPGVDHYVAKMYPWENDYDHQHIGDFVVVSFPYLETGDVDIVGPGNNNGGGNVTADESAFDGVWEITEMLGLTLQEWADDYDMDVNEINITMVVENGNLTMISADDDDNYTTGLIYGREYEGHPAALLAADYEEGYEYLVVLLDDNTTELVTPEDGTVMYKFVRSDGSDTGNISVNPDAQDHPQDLLYDVAGVWYGETENDGPMGLSISTNYIMTEYTEYYLDNKSFILMNPTESGYDLYVESGDTYVLVGSMTYDLENDTLFVTDSDTNEEVMFERQLAGEYFDYFGEWTMYSYEGMTMEEYCEAYGAEPDDFAMNFDIGQYSVFVTESSGVYVCTPKNLTDNSVQIAFDSSYFFDCTYDPETETLTSVLRFDDSDETQTAIFKRGSHFFTSTDVHGMG